MATANRRWEVTVEPGLLGGLLHLPDSQWSIWVYNEGPGTIFFGEFDVTAAVGLPLEPGDQQSFDATGLATTYVCIAEGEPAEIRALEVA